MEKEFLPYEIALAMKSIGFDEPCLAQYKKYDAGETTLDIGFSKNEIISKFDNLILFCSAPLYQQCWRWFREKYRLDKIIDNWTEQPMNGEIWDKAYQYYINGEAYHPYFKTHEEAELECLKKLIEIVKNK
jgi:hypothetical protein